MAAYGRHITFCQSNPRFKLGNSICISVSSINEILTHIIIVDEDKELTKLLTGYQDMVGLLNVHKVAQINTQVCIPVT